MDENRFRTRTFQSFRTEASESEMAKAPAKRKTAAKKPARKTAKAAPPARNIKVTAPAGKAITQGALMQVIADQTEMSRA
jgi:hypothetical protein